MGISENTLFSYPGTDNSEQQRNAVENKVKGQD